MEKKKRMLNAPNTLSILRVLLVPGFMAAAIFMRNIEIWGQLVPAALFALTAFTDMLDGKIARKYNLVTDFGKFIDPLADKFMVFGALVSVLYVSSLTKEAELFTGIFVWVALIVMFRELAITSLRLVISGKSGKVVAASWWGKVKTMTQCISIVVFMVNPIYAQYDFYITSYVGCAAVLITTIGSGLDYFRAYMPYINPND